jgi:hypothetical protein
MKNLLNHMKSMLLAAGLLTATIVMADNVIGEPVTDFTDPAYMKLDWPYGLTGATRTLVRSELLTFRINAPKAGCYGVEYLVNATGSNVQLAATATSYESNAPEPEFTDFAHMICMTDAELPEPVEPSEPVDGEEPVEPFVPADPVYMYSSVDLESGVNYVHVWMHVYWRNDALPQQKVQFKQIRVLPEGSGNVAKIAARASQKAFRVKYFRSLQDATTATVVSDYEALLAAIQTDLAKADTAAVSASIAAAEAKELAVRHGKGVIVGQDSTRIDLLLYHNEYNNPDTMAPLGGYDESGSYEMETGLEDYPEQLEFTRYNYFTYKFTAADELPEGGSWYIQYLCSSQNNATIDMTILAEDSATVIMPTYKLETNNGQWQSYELRDKRDVAKFQLEPGKTYYLHMYYKEYTNVRDILVRYSPKEYHTAAQLEELMVQAQAILYFYREGTDEYYAVEDRTLLDRLQEAVDLAEEVVFDEDPERVDEAYEKLNDALIALSALKVLNILPTTGYFDITQYDNSRNCGSKADGGIWQLDNFRSGGYMIYKLYNKQDARYQVDFEFAHQNDGPQMEFQFYVVEDGIDFVTSDTWSEQYGSTGGWQVFEPKHLDLGGVPQGYVYLKISGEGNGQTYVGNPRQFQFTVIPGTEGEGAKALAAAKEAYYAQFTVESVQALIDEAKAFYAPYADGALDHLLIDRAPVDALAEAIAQAEASLGGEAEGRKDAFFALQEAIKGMKNVKLYNVAPTTAEMPFNVNNGAEWDKWKSEGSNIGYGYEGGSVVYTIYATEDAKYNMTVNMSNPAPKNFEEKDEEGNVVSSTPNEEHAVVSVTAMKDSISFFNTTYNVPNTGGWGNKEEVVVENIPMPAGLLQLKLFGEKAVGGWVGNIYNISFAKVEGTEGQGSQGISEVNVAGTIAKGIYSLGGQYMGSDLRRMPKGLYIVNGRKVIIK